MLLTFKNISLITEAEKDQALCENSPCIYGGKEQVDAEEHLLYLSLPVVPGRNPGALTPSGRRRPCSPWPSSFP